MGDGFEFYKEGVVIGEDFGDELIFVDIHGNFGIPAGLEFVGAVEDPIDHGFAPEGGFVMFVFGDDRGHCRLLDIIQNPVLPRIPFAAIQFG